MARAVPDLGALEPSGTVIEGVYEAEGLVLQSDPVTGLAFLEDVDFYPTDPYDWAQHVDGLEGSRHRLRAIDWSGATEH